MLHLNDQAIPAARGGTLPQGSDGGLTTLPGRAYAGVAGPGCNKTNAHQQHCVAHERDLPDGAGVSDRTPD